MSVSLHQLKDRFAGSVVELLLDAAIASPDRRALVCEAKEIDYRTYAHASLSLAVELLGQKPVKGRIGTIIANSIDACIAHFAVMAAGAQLLPMNPAYTARELAYQLEDADLDLVLADATLQTVLEPLLSRRGIQAIWVGHEGRYLADTPLADASALPGIDPGSLGILQYTGGTSGKPKGVNLTHASLRANVQQREAVLPTREDEERILCTMPLFHSYGMAMGLYLSARCRGTLVILPAYRREALLEAIEAHAITIFPGSPTIYIGLLDHPKIATTNWHSVKTCYSGASALPVEVLNRWRSIVGVPIFEGYGQTEAGPVLAYNGPHAAIKAGSVGHALPDTEIEIVDIETGRSVMPQGISGEIRARGPQIMQGYRNLPLETSEALRDGWLYTGDVGVFDEDGYLYIQDRKKDLVIVGGYNVYPREVEEVLLLHPEVIEAAVIARSDDYRGQSLHAFVVLRRNGTCRADELLDHCAQNLAKYKLPAHIDFIDALPKTSVGKIDKKALNLASECTTVRSNT